MPLLTHWRRFLLIASLATGVGVAAEQTAAPADTATAREKSTASRSAGGDLQKLMQQVSAQRERMIADHEALAKQLKDATDERRKQIFNEMQAQKKEFEAAQSALHKMIRDEQRRQRLSAAPGGR